MPNWDQRYMDLADHVAQWSKDTTTKVGCVIVGEAGQILSTGYNGLPRGVNDNIPERMVQPEKELWTEHAERNAIYNAARSGLSLVGSTLYCRYRPCAQCAKGIIQSGIKHVTIANGELHPRWRESTEVGQIMLAEAGVVVLRLDGNGSNGLGWF